MKYSIHSSRSGELLVASVELDSIEIESLSSESSEGHFCAGALQNGEIVLAGVDKDASVFALAR
jgi:hypothetical protein